MPGRRALLLLLGALTPSLGVAVVSTTASAADDLPAWTPCSPRGFECLTLGTALDPSDDASGTIRLSAKRVRAASNPNRVAVIGLAGGPGQAALPLAEDFAATLAPAETTRDLLLFDQRGTGRSSPLTCAALRRRASVVTTSRRCALELGRRRGFFRTAETVADLEALRRAGGYEKLALYGVSYGTKVALAYASAHPDRVESLVLDSVTPPEGPDAFRRSSLRAVRRVTDGICGRELCRGITPSASGDLARLAARVRKHPLRGVVRSRTGRPVAARLTESGLLTIMLAGDLNPTLRSELPGSLRAALAGDPAPILRLRVRATVVEDGARAAAAPGADDESDALFLATTCEENPTLPWRRGASLAARERSTSAALRALRPSALGPFSRAVAFSAGYAPFCLGWPEASAAPPRAGALPAVPTLVIAGRSDVRTPLEDAAAVAARIPGARLLPVPFVGHSVLGSDPTSCAKDALDAFYAGGPVAQCVTARPRFAPTPRPPRRAADVEPYRTLSGRLGRTVEALRLTVNDAQSQVVGEALALGRRPRGAGGLRSGSVSVVGGGLRLRGYEYVPGVRVTGTLPARGTAVLTVSGSEAATGTVRVSNSLAVEGRLGGRRVSTRFGGAATTTARPFDGLTLARAVAIGARARAGR